MVEFWRSFSALLFAEIMGVGFVAGMKLDRYQSLNGVVKAKYDSLGIVSDKELVECFCKCSVQHDIPQEVLAALNEIVHNKVGKEILRIVGAKLYPFAECARTLEGLVSAIPVNFVSDNEKVSKAKKVVLLFDALKVQNEDVVSCFSHLERFLEPLKRNPIVFPDASVKYKSGSLLGVFKSDVRLTDKKSRQMFVVDQINLYWDSTVRSVVDGFLPLLRLGMFSLELGAMRYIYDHTKRQYVISFSNRGIVARSLTGPFLVDEIDSIRTPPICCFMDDREIPAPAGLHHEIFHHLVIGLEGDGFGSFSRLAKVF